MGEQERVGLVGRVLRRAGYVSEARARKLSDSLERAQAQVAELKRALEAAKRETKELREKHRERSEKSQQERSEGEARYQARLARMEQKAEEEAKRMRARESERAARLDEARQRLQTASEKMARIEKSTQLGREHLMVMEVKLDIVEGAIKVLDQRTRAALSAREERSGLRGSGRLP